MARKKKNKSRKKKNTKSNRNFVAVAMNKRYKVSAGPMKDKRLKRKNKTTWKNDEENEL